MAEKKKAKPRPGSRAKKPLPDSVTLPADEIWWRLLLGRIAQVEAKLPKDLLGAIQFEVHRKDGSDHFFHLRLDRSGAASSEGLAADAVSWIEASESDMKSLLEGQMAGALKTSGDVALVERFFQAIAGMPKTRSVIGVRVGG